LISQATQAGYYPQVIIRFFFCFCLLIGPTFLMGGTLAVIGRHVIGHRQHFGRNTAILYGVNTAGALLGAFAAGFFLIRYLGHIDSLRFAAVLNFFVSAIALVTDMWLRKRPLENSVLIKQKRFKRRPKPKRIWFSSVWLFPASAL
jgi:spermidine synthase